MVAAGAGGRLAMRLLAVTSPDDDGAITEAEATIGEITAGGTLGFILFAGLPAGLLAGALYAVAGPVVPARAGRRPRPRRVLLVLVGWWLEPLRAGNFDFNLVGPDWLSLLAFAAIALLQGVLVVALAARFSRGVPPRTPRPRPARRPDRARGRRPRGAAGLRRQRRGHPLGVTGGPPRRPALSPPFLPPIALSASTWPLPISPARPRFAGLTPPTSDAATDTRSASEPGGPVSCIPLGSTQAGSPTRSCGAV